MNADFRVSVDFFTHHKARKLKKRLGSAALLSLLQLWAYAAKLRTDGNLSGMTPEDIELASEWDGEEGTLCASLLDIGFLDHVESGFILHDWAENNPWVAEEKARSERAQKNAQARWDKEKQRQPHQSGNAHSKPQQCAGNATAMQPHQSGNAPSPSPAPTHKGKKGEGVCAHAHVATSVPESPNPHSEIFLKSLESSTSSPEVDPEIVQGDEQFLAGAKRRDGPKKTDSPSKGHPQWVSFLSCWQVYPVQQGQEDAWREWMRLHDTGTLAACWEIRDAILTMAAEDTWWQQGGAPKMAKWLAGKGWNDQPHKKPAQTTAVTVRDGPPVARTAYQQQRQGQTSLAGAVLQADRRLKQHGDNSENHYGNGQNVDGLPPPAITGGIASHGGSMDGITAGSGR